MKTDKYIYRSHFNNGTLFSFPFATVCMIWLIYYREENIRLWLLLLIGVLLNYLIFAVFISRWYFYDDRMVRIFVFRPFFREKVYIYEQLNKIKYHNAGRDGGPWFIVFRKKKQYFMEFNSFRFNKRAARTQITESLLSKNIKLEVRTDHEETDKDIIDLVKRKYPRNIRLDPMLPESYKQRILKR
jgi:hypothetical protein